MPLLPALVSGCVIPLLDVSQLMIIWLVIALYKDENYKVCSLCTSEAHAITLENISY